MPSARMQLISNNPERLPLSKKISMIFISVSVIGAFPLLLQELTPNLVSEASLDSGLITSAFSNAVRRQNVRVWK